MTMYDRRHSNPGKREREAGKRHRRATWSHMASDGAEWTTLKLGHKHQMRHFRRQRLRSVMTVAESEKRAKGERKNLAKTESSLAGFSLLLGLRPSENSEKLNHHTILFPADYDAEFEAIFSTKQPVAKPTIYICAPNDPLMVKDAGHESWFVLVNAPRHDESGKTGFDWRDENFKHKYANTIIDQIEARGIKIRERLDVLEIRTPLDLQESVMAPGGSIYGTSSNSASAAFLRTKNRSPIKNLFCVGGSTHPGGGLPLVGISAEIVANAIGRAR